MNDQLVGSLAKIEFPETLIQDDYNSFLESWDNKVPDFLQHWTEIKDEVFFLTLSKRVFLQEKNNINVIINSLNTRSRHGVHDVYDFINQLSQQDAQVFLIEPNYVKNQQDLDFLRNIVMEGCKRKSVSYIKNYHFLNRDDSSFQLPNTQFFEYLESTYNFTLSENTFYITGYNSDFSKLLDKGVFVYELNDHYEKISDRYVKTPGYEGCIELYSILGELNKKRIEKIQKIADEMKLKIFI